MSDPNYSELYDILKDIRDDFHARHPVVVSTMVPTSDTSVVIVNGIERTVIAWAVWSTGDVTPIYTLVPGHGHIQTLSPDETWHFPYS